MYDSSTMQARRHYIYDTQHRTCDISILDLLPGISKRILLYFDVEALIENLKNNEELSKEQRIIQWQDIKVALLYKGLCFLVSATYLLILLSFFMETTSN